MKPLHILGFLLCTFALLTIISLVFPADGIPLSESASLRFPTLKEIFLPEDEDLASIDAADSLAEDSLKAKLQAALIDTATNPDRLHYPNRDKSALYHFFAALDSAQVSGKVIRIVHYGDSQIEEDRMSGLIRERLQTQFGGNGPGLLPAVQVTAATSVRQSRTGDWERFAAFGNDEIHADHKRYGLMTIFARYKGSNATLAFKPSDLAYERSKSFHHLTLLYGNLKGAAKASLIADGKSLNTRTLSSGKEIQAARWQFDSVPSEVTLRFTGDSPDIYGVALDGNNGIALDNVPMRGCSGTIFTNTDLPFWKQAYDTMNVKLIVMQYGGNAMAVIDKDSEVKWYENILTKQLSAMREVNPDATILFIGVADMATKVKGKLQTYPYLEKVRDAMKRVTHAAGGVYWDTYSAMGGKNTMIEWVSMKPPLAAPDYTHFSRKGAEKVAQLFVDELLNDYRDYKAQQHNSKPDLSATADTH